MTVDVERQGQDKSVEFKLGRFDADRMASAETGDQRQGGPPPTGSAPPWRRSPRRRGRSSASTTAWTAWSSPRSTARGIAADAGLEVGDVILQVGDKPVHTPVRRRPRAARRQEQCGADADRASWRPDLRRRQAGLMRPDPAPGPAASPEGRRFKVAGLPASEEDFQMSRRILVVEDDHDTQDYLAKALRETGYTVEATASGRDGPDARDRRRLRRAGARPDAARPRRPVAAEVGTRRRRPDPGDRADRDERHRRAGERPARRRRRLRGQALLLRRAFGAARGGAAPAGRDPRPSRPASAAATSSST